MKKILKKLKIFIFLIFLAFLSFILFKNFREVLYLKKKLDISKEKLAELKKEKERLEEEIEYLSHPHNLEKEIRRRFNLKKPGEKVAVVLPKEEKKEVKKQMSWLERGKNKGKEFLKKGFFKFREKLRKIFLTIFQKENQL